MATPILLKVNLEWLLPRANEGERPHMGDGKDRCDRRCIRGGALDRDLGEGKRALTDDKGGGGGVVVLGVTPFISFAFALISFRSSFFHFWSSFGSAPIWHRVFINCTKNRGKINLKKNCCLDFPYKKR